MSWWGHINAVSKQLCQLSGGEVREVLGMCHDGGKPVVEHDMKLGVITPVVGFSTKGMQLEWQSDNPMNTMQEDCHSKQGNLCAPEIHLWRM